MASSAASPGRRERLRRPRRSRLALVLASGGLLGCEAAQCEAKATMLWPIHLSAIPFSSPGVDALEPPEFAKELANIALRGYEAFVEKFLPKELEGDEQFADEFRATDHSRVNLAFRRWQQHAFADHFGFPVDTLSWQVAEARRVAGVPYSWNELYDSPKFGRLRQWILQISRQYLERSGGEPANQNLTSFVWVEVFGHGDAMSPRILKPGAYLMGRYFVAANKGSFKFNFEDPRGINPPYGKTFSHAPQLGQMLLLPPWVSTFITPNMFPEPAVSLNFAVYPGEGVREGKDRTASLKVDSRAPVPKPQPRR